MLRANSAGERYLDLPSRPRLDDPARSPLLRAAPISPAISLAPFSLRHDAIIIDDGVRSDVLNDLSTFAAANAALLRRRPDRRRSPLCTYPTYVTFAAPSEAIALLHFLRRRIRGSRTVAATDTIVPQYNVVAHADAPNILLPARPNRHVPLPLHRPSRCRFPYVSSTIRSVLSPRSALYSSRCTGDFRAGKISPQALQMSGNGLGFLRRLIALAPPCPLLWESAGNSDSHLCSTGTAESPCPSPSDAVFVAAVSLLPSAALQAIALVAEPRSGIDLFSRGS
ncbi:hypothetical protein FB451DRAFT_1566657 [Mycena latifolia]|nr:hypothetical protein FB451DRAFT_1566657 [Mycena latifolia]